jgi:hypothetical protein
MDLRRFSIYIRSIIAIGLIVLYNLRNIMVDPFKYLLNTPIFYIFILFVISYLVTMNPTTSLAIAILISILTVSNKSTPLTGLSEGFQTEGEAIKQAIADNEPFRQDVAEAHIKDVVTSFGPNIRAFLNSSSFEVPNEVEQQKRTVDYCNQVENADKGICRWFSTLQPDTTRPEVTPVTAETRLNEIFRKGDETAPPTTEGVAIPETFYNFDMGCDSCGSAAPQKKDCPLTLRNLAIGNIESADGTTSDFTASYAPVDF